VNLRARSGFPSGRYGSPCGLLQPRRSGSAGGDADASPAGRAALGPTPDGYVTRNCVRVATTRSLDNYAHREREVRRRLTRRQESVPTLTSREVFCVDGGLDDAGICVCVGLRASGVASASSDDIIASHSARVTPRSPKPSAGDRLVPLIIDADIHSFIHSSSVRLNCPSLCQNVDTSCMLMCLLSLQIFGTEKDQNEGQIPTRERERERDSTCDSNSIRDRRGPNEGHPSRGGDSPSDFRRAHLDGFSRARKMAA
jgi:hypothetical protein